jgi:sulfur carrier protein
VTTPIDLHTLNRPSLAAVPLTTASVFARFCRVQSSKTTPVRITLNGDPYDLEQPVSVQELLERLNIDPRRVAVEHNMVIVRRHAFAATLVGDGDHIEIVNFVGGGSDV